MSEESRAFESRPDQSWRERLGRSRPFPHVRLVRVTLRTLHLLAFGVLFGGHFYGVHAERLYPALWATVASGGALMALEMYRSPVWPVQVRGLAAVAKIALVATVALDWENRVALLAAAIVIGGVSSHMPGRYRYYSVVHGRVVGGRESG